MSINQCRNYLQAIGKPYPKSSCQVCGGIFSACKYEPEGLEQSRLRKQIDRNRSLYGSAYYLTEGGFITQVIDNNKLVIDSLESGQHTITVKEQK